MTCSTTPIEEHLIRDGEPHEAETLEELQRRAAMASGDYRDRLAAHPEAVELPPDAILEHRVRVTRQPDGRIAGFSVVLAVAKSSCELDGLFVEPDLWGRGTGRRLVADVAQRARAQGAAGVEVTADPRSVGFYARLGFNLAGSVPTRFGRAHRMRLAIGAIAGS